MPYVLEIPLDNGEAMLVEVTGQVQGVVPAGRPNEIIGKLPEALSEGLDRVQSFAGEVLSRMRTSMAPPDVLAVEFGLTFSTKMGVIVAESSGEAHLKVTAEWHQASAKQLDDSEA